MSILQQALASGGSREWTFGRVLPVALIFAALGPLAGGLMAALPVIAISTLKHGTVADAGGIAVAMTLHAYGFGAALALLTGVTVALSRILGGRTTVATPIAAVVLVYGCGLLLNPVMNAGLAQLFPASVSAARLLLLPCVIASVVCWLVVRRARLV